MGIGGKTPSIELIRQRIRRMQEAGVDIDLEQYNGRCRLITKGGKRNLGPAGTKSEILIYLEMYESGWEDGRRYGWGG